MGTPFRALLALLVAAATASAEGGARLSPEQHAELERVMGAEWGRLPPWRQRMVEERYARFLELPEGRRREAGDLRGFLLRPARRFEVEELPPPLRDEIGRLPHHLRADAGKLAILRLRQLRLDRGLRCVPRAERWAMFDRLFPDGAFDPDEVKRAHEDLKAHVARAMAESIRQDLGRAAAANPEFDTEAHKREFVRRKIEREEHRLVDEVRRDLETLRRGGHGGRGRGPRGLEALERIGSVTPRQQELVRYALRPHECPLLDLEGVLGARPEDPAAHGLWMRDFHVLGRMELLGAAGFPPEIVLHLAGTGSPEDLRRAVKALRR